MRRFLCAVFGTVALALPVQLLADGCYICEEGGHVRYEGSDTFPLRKAAKEQLGCTVTGTSAVCKTPRGTVGAAPKKGTPRAAEAPRGVHGNR